MLPHRFRPVDQRLNSLISEVASQWVTMRRPDHIILVDVPALSFVKVRESQVADSDQSLAIQAGSMPPVRKPIRQVLEFDIEHRRLHIIEKRRVSVIVVLAAVPVFSIVAEQDCHLATRSSLVVMAPPSPNPTQHFEKIKTETPCQSKAAGILSSKCRAQCLSCIFDHGQAVTDRHPSDGVHVTDGPLSRGPVSSGFGSLE